ncbi:MAG: DNA-binding protein [Spirochaetes bacterium]|nr:MAG: DNA-binding protein [Spirochaetota bacterium]
MNEPLTIDPSCMREDEWIPAIQAYINAAKTSGEVVSISSRLEFLTPEQVGDRLGMSRTTVVRAINSGELKASKVGNRHRISSAAVNAYRATLITAAVARLTEDIDLDAPVPANPVSVYDTMREMSNRLVAVYAERITAGGLDDPAIVQIRAVRAEVDAVSATDMEAQKELTEDLRKRYAALI